MDLECYASDRDSLIRRSQEMTFYAEVNGLGTAT